MAKRSWMTTRIALHLWQQRILRKILQLLRWTLVCSRGSGWRHDQSPPPWLRYERWRSPVVRSAKVASFAGPRTGRRGSRVQSIVTPEGEHGLDDRRPTARTGRRAQVSRYFHTIKALHVHPVDSTSSCPFGAEANDHRRHWAQFQLCHEHSRTAARPDAGRTRSRGWEQSAHDSKHVLNDKKWVVSTGRNGLITAFPRDNKAASWIECSQS